MHRASPSARAGSEEITAPLTTPPLAAELAAFRATPLSATEERVLAYIECCERSGVPPNVRDIAIPRDEVEQALVCLRLRGLIEPESPSPS